MNLYPFERTAGRAASSDEEVIENIDIGGPTMIRAAAKNHAFAAVVVTPGDLRRRPRGAARERRDCCRCRRASALAAEAFSYTARYDTAISRWFAEKTEELPAAATSAPSRRSPTCRTARTRTSARAYYAQVGARAHVLSQVRQHHGKQLSYNNLLDLDAARTLVRDLGDAPACVIVKHNNPCGAARRARPRRAPTARRSRATR